MMSELPVILVSAAGPAAAAAVMTELIDEEEPQQAAEAGSRVWVLRNKYYTARVRVTSQAPAQPDLVQAHVIYLTQDEVEHASEVIAERATRGEGDVRLVLARGAGQEAQAAAAAAAARAADCELVWLDAAPAPVPAGPFPELAGIARAREALHAHVWPGLRRAGGEDGDSEEITNGHHEDDDDFINGDAEEDEEEDEDAAAAMERFASALRVLSAARDQPRCPQDESEAARAARLQRADDLLAAFCRALDTPLDQL